ncbi:MAG: glycosyltransferase family 2 protein [Cyanobacteria bacterium P01_G01_bin.19]
MCEQFNNRFVNASLDNILAVIPVRNEEVTIAKIIDSLQHYGISQIRVVNNGSSDRSGTVAQKAGAEVIDEPVAGYGQACWTGLQHIPQGIDWVLFCDGDGSDDLSILPKFFALRQQYDLILGDRRGTIAGKKVMTPVQHFGNGLASWLMGLGWGHKYHDLGPLRLIRKSALDRMAMKDRGFGWTVEMQVRAVEENLNICEIPVNYLPRQGGKSKISGTISGSFQAGTIILSTLGKLYFSSRLRKGKELKERRNQWLLWLSSLFLLVGALAILPYGDFRQAENVVRFGYGIGIMSLGFVLSWGLKSLNYWWFWTIAIATRLILLFMYPGDDIWRYLWEGYIQTQGFSPYDFAPNAAELISYRTSWWSQINHQSISAIYPPLTQLGFRGLASISASVVLFKSSFAIADLGICYLLTKKFTYVESTLYAWNPLVIYSFAGGGHYDSWFILPLVAAWIWFEWQNNLRSTLLLSMVRSVAIGISIAVKWISLPVLGFLSWIAWLKINPKAAAIVAVVGILPLFGSAIAFCTIDSCSLIPTGSTFVSHGRSAEFLPHLLAEVWHASTRTNRIFALPLGLTTLYLIFKALSLQQFIRHFFFALLIISPIIHGWYFTWIIPFAVGTKNWGVRLISLSAFVYFVLPYRQALGNPDWNLTEMETWLLWLPLVIGYFIKTA